jgi:hypothetical protein
MAGRNSVTADVVVHGLNAAGDEFAIPVTDDGAKVKCEIENATLTVDTTGLATSAKQDTGNTSLASIKTDVDKIPSQGTALMAGSTPVTLATNDTQVALLLAALNKITPPTTNTAVTPSDSTDLTGLASKGVWVGTGGNIALKGSGDSAAVTYLSVPDGAFIEGNFIRVMSTNTTASNIVAKGG